MIHKTEQLVLGWAEDRGLLAPENMPKQALKLAEEVGETCRGVIKLDQDAIRDGIGDCMVVLTILAAQAGMSLSECYGAAWDEIKNRTGETINGVFIKDSGK